MKFFRCEQGELRIYRLEVVWSTPFWSSVFNRDSWNLERWPDCFYGCKIADVGPFTISWLSPTC